MTARRRGARVPAALALAVWLLAAPGSAHPAPFSYLDVQLEPGRVRGVLVVHDFDAAHELGLSSPEALADAAVVRGVRDRLVAILAGRLSLQADGRPLALAWHDVDTLPDRQSLRLTFTAGASAPGRLTVEAHLFPYDPLHQTFVNVYEQGALRHQAILDASRQRLEYYAGTAQGTLAVLAVFLPAGIAHILIGPDHVLFLVALLLLGGTLWRLAAIVTAFTIGHSVTLSLAALDLAAIPPAIVEPLIALSIVVVGADNLLVARARATARAADTGLRDIRVLVAAGFGLIHGFGFASVLREFGLPAGALGWSLFAFNLGVEVGQLAIVLAVAAALEALRRRSRALGDRVAVAGSLGVVLAGSYWFLERVL